MHEAARVRIGQRVADLAQQVNGAVGGHRTELPDQRLEVAAREQLHHVVERAVLGDAEVEQLNRVRRAQLRGRLRLALETAKRQLHLRVAARPQHLRAHQLDRRVARQQPVLGPPHLAHAAACQAAPPADSCPAPAPRADRRPTRCRTRDGSTAINAHA